MIDLIKAEGRVSVAIPGDLRDEKFCQVLVDGLSKVSAALVSNAGGNRRMIRFSISRPKISTRP